MLLQVNQIIQSKQINDENERYISIKKPKL
jgi:hypothetical protein